MNTSSTKEMGAGTEGICFKEVSEMGIPEEKSAFQAQGTVTLEKYRQSLGNN